METDLRIFNIIKYLGTDGYCNPVFNKYYYANDIKELISKFNLDINTYTLKDGREIMKMITPKGQGYGKWEENLEFNFNKDIDNIISVGRLGYINIRINEIFVEK